MSGRAIAGGLLSGLGRGMVMEAEEKRAAALARAQMIAKRVEKEEDRNWQEGRDEANREFQLIQGEMQNKRALEREKAADERRRTMPTNNEREYVLASKDPGFREHLQTMRRASATNVTVGAEEKEFDKNIGKQMADQYAAIQDGAKSARSKIATLDALDEAIKGAGYTGTGAKAAIAAKRALALFGGDPNVSDAEAAVALGNQLALQMRNPSGGAGMPGALSDKDREFLVASVPGVEKTPEGNRRLLDYMRRMERRSIEVAKRADEYMRDNNGRLDFRFYDDLAQWSERNPLFSDASPAAAASSPPGRAQGKVIVRTGRLPDGRRVIQYADGTTETK